VKLEARTTLHLRLIVRRTMFCHGDITRRIGIMLKESGSWGIQWVEHASPEAPVARPSRPIGPQLHSGSLWTRGTSPTELMVFINPPTLREAPCSNREIGMASTNTRSDD
jgi:hypothetical protein